MAFSPDSNRLATGDGSNGIRTGPADRHVSRESAQLVGHAGPVLAIAYSSDGRMLASAGHDKTVRLWHTSAFRPRVEGVYERDQKSKLLGHGPPATTVAFSADGSLLASGSLDRSVRLWDPTTGSHLYTLDTGDAAVHAAAFGTDRVLAAAGEDGVVRIWTIPQQAKHPAPCATRWPDRAVDEPHPGRRHLAAAVAGLGCRRCVVRWNPYTGWCTDLSVPDPERGPDPATAVPSRS